MQQHSTSTALEEVVDALVRRKGLAYVERQYDSGLMSAVIEPAFERWKRKATRRRAAHRVPVALVAVMLLVASLALTWSV